MRLGEYRQAAGTAYSLFLDCVLAWLRDRRKLLRRYRFLTIAARLLQFDCILYFLAALLWLEQGFCDITLLCIRHRRPFVVTRSDILAVVGMLDKQAAGAGASSIWTFHLPGKAVIEQTLRYSLVAIV